LPACGVNGDDVLHDPLPVVAPLGRRFVGANC
jgi:hypothetical protein